MPDGILGGDLLLMVGAAVACVPIFVSGNRISRPEGAASVVAYAGYLGWLLLSQT